MVVDDDAAERLRAVPERGGTLLVTYLSGICGEDGKVITGGFPGAFRDVLGVRCDEFYPLQEGEQVTLEDGALVEDWTERVYLDSAEPIVRYASSSLAGGPAVTRRQVGNGTAWYVSAPLQPEAVDRIVERLVEEADLLRILEADPGLEAARRIGPDCSYLFLLNHTDTERAVTAEGLDLLSGTRVGPAGGVRVVREPDRSTGNPTPAT
ncbi:beta-galactosidase trimerization domain-containing protein [Glycomyces sp. TRM65418]|uniref:beta-galactosidase trimerization domain-containing protein n=1 Tax=Glycomyces sp. TRM65418 TaxID=2867006 RepID=UPI001D15F826|nr:beta-galactosidase trimerization domain-containing protein [Glycomyces sp. TRM65418]MCC3764485.1 beta-galactosidase trimerization domain-containing protein [Glycomyces sp. TRM65418]